MKRRIIPYTLTDKATALLIPMMIIAIIFSIERREYAQIWLYFVILLIVIVGVYVFQDRPNKVIGINRYEEMISKVRTIGHQLGTLSKFLEAEQKRITETEATLSKLSEEKQLLEPVVQTYRETVEAILKANASRIARNVWKERLISFALGVVASLVASFAINLFIK
jgi:sensor c-di-GMP phosphodiesterase-like protein